jgi:uncharacterized membrane protein YdjX (TVP38/TMEM64 family)
MRQGGSHHSNPKQKMSRWWLLILILVTLVITPFFIWGEALAATSMDDAVDWLRTHGQWAWLAGVVLLCADIVLPIPGTLVMSGLGILYGPLIGGLLAALGSISAGLIAYAACRFAGHRAAEWIAGRDALAQGEAWFRTRSAGWVVALSRWAPILPETMSCLAGLARMPFPSFLLALLAGSLPLGFVFAAIGHLGAGEHSGLALALSAGIPLLLYAVALKILHQQQKSPP